MASLEDGEQGPLVLRRLVLHREVRIRGEPQRPLCQADMVLHAHLVLLARAGGLLPQVEPEDVEEPWGQVPQPLALLRQLLPELDVLAPDQLRPQGLLEHTVPHERGQPGHQLG
eukprot:1276675-Heterocapsa_arctica.AAC.1